MTAAIAGACAVIVTGCISIGAARRSVDTSVLVVMGSALGIAKAFEMSGLSHRVGDALALVATPLGHGERSPQSTLQALYSRSL